MRQSLWRFFAIAIMPVVLETDELYLFAYEFPDLIIVFTEGVVIFLSTKKKIDIIRQIEETKPEDSVNFQYLIRNDTDNSSSFDYMWEALTSSYEGKKWGFLLRDEECFFGPFIEEYKKYFTERIGQSSTIEKVDATSALHLVLGLKEQDELIIIKRAATLSADVMQNHFRTHMETIISEEKKVLQSELAEKIEDFLTSPSKFGVKTHVQEEYVDSCYTPVVQSYAKGSEDDDTLKSGVITCSLGARYKNYCSNISRTYLVDPSPTIEAQYQLLYSIREELLRILVPGVELHKLHDTAVKLIEGSEYPHFVSNLGKSVGFGMGIEFRESSLLLNAKNMKTAQIGMVFNLSVALKDIVADGLRYSLVLADTVVVREGEAQTFTENCESDLPNISYTLDDRKSPEEDSSPQYLKQETRRRSNVLASRTRQEDRVGILTEDEIRKKKQEEISKRLHEEAKIRLIRMNHKVEDHSIGLLVKLQIIIQWAKIHVDSHAWAVILPVFGQAVPFHISMIKNTSLNIHGEVLLRYSSQLFFILNSCRETPLESCGSTCRRPVRTSFGKPNPILSLAHPENTFIKEFVYRSTQPKRFNDISIQIKELQNRYKQEEARRRELDGLVEQQELVLSKSKNNPRLSGLYVRPQFSRGRVTGVLEAHENGFRYACKGVKLDILYSNIRYAFFQPSAHELIVLLHFHLKTPILAPYSKKQSDIQFFTEAIESVQDLGGKSYSSHGDRDELEAEQRERRLKQRIDQAFKSFTEKVKEVTFEQPIRNLGFNGVPGKNNVFLMPTADCLVSLTEQPVHVFPLEDVEVAHFERVRMGNKNFDLVFIYKDYKTWNRITAIELNNLDVVKDWLTQYGIKYYELRNSINWDTILKCIAADPKQFLDDGGWDNLEGSDSEESEETDEDDYQPSEAEDESDDYDSEYSDDESGSEYYGSAGAEEEESGEDWDELERKAAAEDRQTFGGAYSDEENDKVIILFVQCYALTWTYCCAR
ncbi:hypothetical protein Zmor_004328 [Zophobas morio]|uniref:FACT complex subunit n=1 Tax=Zophobas morio TaxID=2755281 RepID=A0AA38HJ96_9CUCU|nr:hypothetical protein Zmor_004328 [Zophobas morio]